MSDAEKAELFRRRANELRERARQIPSDLRQDLYQVALEWERLAEVAEREGKSGPAHVAE